MNIYKEKGYKSRKDYLTQLAGNYCVDKSLVFSLAQMLGPSEDFDGLVVALEDADHFGLSTSQL